MKPVPPHCWNSCIMFIRLMSMFFVCHCEAYIYVDTDIGNGDRKYIGYMHSQLTSG